mgnify:CR=1 FL=1
MMFIRNISSHNVICTAAIFLSFTLQNSIIKAQDSDTINQIKLGSRDGYWIINGDLAKNKDYVPVAKVEEGMFKMGRKTGLWTKYYPSGSVKSKIKYVNGKSQGNFITYYQKLGLTPIYISKSVWPKISCFLQHYSNVFAPLFNVYFCI